MIEIQNNTDENFTSIRAIAQEVWPIAYGKILSQDPAWMITQAKMALTNNAKFMHCLPVRRNVVVEDAVLDSPNSVVIQEAGNRIWAAQAVLKKILLEQLREQSPYLF